MNCISVLLFKKVDVTKYLLSKMKVMKYSIPYLKQCFNLKDNYSPQIIS